MKLHKLKWLTGMSAIVLLILGAILFSGRSTDESTEITITPASEKSTTVANKLQWRAGRSQTYDVLVDSSFVMTMPGASSGQEISVNIDAILDYQTLEVKPSEVIVGMRFSSMEMKISGVTEEAVNDALTQPFRVHIAPNGLPVSFEFPAAVAAEHREIIENFIRMFQLAIEDGKSWVVQEANSSGNYEAAYTRNSPTMLLKEKQRFLSSSSSVSDTLPVLESQETIRIDGNNDWISDMELDESFSSKDQNGPSVVVTNHASLMLRNTKTATSSASWDFVSSMGASANTQLANTKPAISRAEAERRLRADIAKLDKVKEGRSLLIHSLRNLLLANDEMPFVLLDYMKTEQLSDRTRADLYLALELAGSPQAQAALTSVFTDQNWSFVDAMRAIVALSGVAKPTDDAVSALWDTAYISADGTERDELPGTAALALGTLGRNMNKEQDDQYFSLRSGLINGVSSAADTHQRAVYLHALGNTGDPDPTIRNNITPFLNDSAPEVRSAAARTLGRLGSAEVADQLLQSFEQEQNDVVRSSITEALSSWENPTQEAITTIKNAISNEHDENVRYNMAVLLGNSMDKFPENRKVLETLLAKEQSKRIRQQVAEMLFKPQ